MNMSDAGGTVLAALLEARTGQHLTMSRRWRIETALQPLVRERGFASMDALVGALVGKKHGSLADDVVDALLNNETFFYRDRPSFETLLGPGLERLRAQKAAERRLAIWSAGCSSGQELYSLAIAFAEQKARWEGWSIDLLGTDVSRGAIERAKSGLYSQFEVQRGLPVVQMIRWFDEYPAQTWRASSALRAAVRFHVHSVLDAPPCPGAFDLILCRNVFLYFAQPTRRAAFARLAEASRPGGMLMLGAGEAVAGQCAAFQPDPDCRGFYGRAADRSGQAGDGRARAAS
ncbi:MAG TPA: protein-glutamate O-methyltransferase CheR [Allosphingosinicella sp.]|jgi:chemotaxis protein methyltransferase CheR